MGQNVVGDFFVQAFIEDEVFSQKSGLHSFFFDDVSVVDDPAVELVHIFKSIVFEVGAGLFAANPSGAVEQDFFVFLTFEHVFDHRKFFAKGISIGTEGLFKSSYPAFVVIAHVDDHHVFLIERLMKFLRRKMSTDITDVIFSFAQAIGHDLLADLDF